MQTTLIVGIFTLLSLNLYANQNCDLLKKSIKISTQGPLEQNFNAGEQAIVQIKIEILEPSILSEWKFVPLMFNFANNISGSNSISSQDVDLKNIESNHIEYLKFDLTSAMGGEYYIHSILWALEPGYCVVTLSGLKLMKLKVLNNLNQIDINPPVISKIETARKEYSEDDTVVLTFTVDDKSDICTQQHQDNQDCKQVKHIELKSARNTLNFYDYKIERIAGNLHSVSFQLKSSEHQAIQAGSYFVTIVNLEDVNGNKFAEVEQDKQTSFLIK